MQVDWRIVLIEATQSFIIMQIASLFGQERFVFLTKKMQNCIQYKLFGIIIGFQYVLL